MVKLLLVNEDGEVVKVWDDIEECNLNKSIARSVLVDEIRDAIDSTKKEPGND